MIGKFNKILFLVVTLAIMLFIEKQVFAVITDGFIYPVGAPSNHEGWEIIQGFGGGHDGYKGHLGEDYNILGEGDKNKPVYCIANGILVGIKRDKGDGTGWGEAVLIEHKLPDDSIVYSLYAHLSKEESYKILLNENQINKQEVLRGQLIGYVGKTGYSTDYHLHLGIKEGKDFGAGYTGTNFSGNTKEYGGVTYHKPSYFIEKYKFPTNTAKKEWDFNDTTEGWSLHGATHDRFLEGKRWIFDPKDDPYIYSQNLSINANEYNTIEINMASNCKNRVGKVYFKTSAQRYI